MMTGTVVNRQGKRGIILVIVLAALSIVWLRLTSSDAERDLLRIQKAFAEQRCPEAVRFTEQFLAAYPEHPFHSLLQAEALLCRELFTSAQTILQVFTPSTPVEEHWQQVLLGRCAAALGELREAEFHLEKALETDSSCQDARRLLVGVLHAQSRFWEAKELAQKLLMQEEDVTFEQLLIASGYQGTLSKMKPWPLTLNQESRWLHDARRLMNTGDFKSAKDYLRRVLLDHPTHGEAQGWYGQILAEERSGEFATWHIALPEQTHNHPEIWFARGIAAKNEDQFLLAARCMAKTILLDDLHAEAARQFAELQEIIPVAAAQSLFAVDAVRLNRLRTFVNDLGQTRDCEVVRATLETLLDLSRPNLVRGWDQISRQLQCQPEGAAAFLSENLQIQAVNPPEELLSLANQGAFPNWDLWEFSISKSGSVTPATDIQFTDVAQQVGIRFQFQSGSTPDLPLAHLLETTGGGIGVVDYDADGWPDLYLAQGRDWRTASSLTTESNRLYRNQFGHAFSDVTEQAELGNTDFSQGVCAGDFNGDGFTDLYVCQVGGNRFYENMGDGTFSDITPATGTAGGDWSLSAGIADLDRDGHPDLYVVNYLELEAVRTEPCELNGLPRACPPTKFLGARDQVYLNSGDGTFLEIGRLAVQSERPGKGMGLSIADFSGDGDLEVFVGNDGEPNFFYRRQALSDGSSVPRFSDVARLSGVATDASGVSQATMGVATGDVNNDGLPDLFVTSFYGESNTLYLQKDSLFFSDDTASAGLQTASLSMLGFGTQMLDVDLDGDQDLFVANGHVDRSSVTAEPDRMRPQFFLQIDPGQFQIIPPNVHTPYLGQQMLGRSVATLDWNRDGFCDLAVTHLDRPFALLTNRTRSTGNRFHIQLISTAGDRNGVGTRVSVTAGEQEWTQQVTAGNGYLASNERSMIFGLNTFRNVDSVTVRWASGRVERFAKTPAGRYLCVEGESKLMPLD